MSDEIEKPTEANPTNESTPAPAGEKAQAAADPRISIDDFAKVELRVGVIKEAGAHPNADRLLVLQVDLGEESLRQVVAGIRSSWEPEELLGRTIVVAANLKPARLRGVESCGMILAVKGTSKVIPLGVDGDVEPGTRVT